MIRVKHSQKEIRVARVSYTDFYVFTIHTYFNALMSSSIVQQTPSNSRYISSGS